MDPEAPTDPKGRLLGGTELNWCKAVPGGTGITVLALLLSQPIDQLVLQNALHRLLKSHPILRARLTRSTPPHDNNRPSFSIPPTPSLQIRSHGSSATSDILRRLNSSSAVVSPFHSLLEHELNQNPWSQSDTSLRPMDVFFASAYAVPDSTSSVLVLRLHTSICDRRSGITVLREFMGLIRESGEVMGEFVGSDEGHDGAEIIIPGLEDLIPSKHSQKPFWARGRDLIGYTINFKRSAYLPFHDAESPRSSEVMRMEFSSEETRKLLSECEEREIKLWGALAAAGLTAAISSKHLENNQSQTYSVITLVNCRKYLEPPPCDHDLGFYYSAIQNTHTVHGGDALWEVSARCCSAFTNSMNYNKHLTDMGELNFLMCQAIENPHLTPLSSVRTALISVFEEPMMDVSCDLHRQVGVEDYVGCSSVHGVGPSIAIFDTIRDGRLDCACVYPSPLHSRQQMQKLVGDMKKILVGGNHFDENKLEA